MISLRFLHTHIETVLLVVALSQHVHSTVTEAINSSLPTTTSTNVKLTSTQLLTHTPPSAGKKYSAYLITPANITNRPVYWH